MEEKRGSDSFAALSVDETLKQLQADPVTGLTDIEAKRRIDQYGHNEVAEKRQNPLVGFLKRFWGLTAWMLEIAIVLSFVLGKYLDLYIIAALLLVNAILGFAQEQQATRAVKALKQKL
jgi:H+-transporting ATPase